MSKPVRSIHFFFTIDLRKAATLATMLTLVVVLAPPWQAQTFKVLYNFAGQNGGGYPAGVLAMDRGGNLYGSASFGQNDLGTVYKLTKKNSGWLLAPLYAFKGGLDGEYTGRGVTIGPDGAVYVTTGYGGLGCGTIASLRPPPTRPPTPLSPWDESVLHRFRDDQYNCIPGSAVTFDQSGNLYGVVDYSGPDDGGLVYELLPSGSGWTYEVLHAFASGEGGQPNGAVVFDGAGNIYGANAFGGPHGNGTIFQLTPSGSGWTLNTLTGFPQSSSDGYRPYGGVILDPAGNVYGTTVVGGSGEGGTVFMLASGTWTFSVLYSFIGDGGGPVASLTRDADGSLYGTTTTDGAYQQGNVFKLTPSNGGWAYTDLHDFTGGIDGGYPDGTLALDGNGNIYGTADIGGTGSGCNHGCGLVFEITP